MPITVKYENRLMLPVSEIAVGEVFEYMNTNFIRVAELKMAMMQDGRSLERLVAVNLTDGKFLTVPEGATAESTTACVHPSATLVVES